MTLDEIILIAVKDALQRNDGNKNKTAKELGIGRTTVYRILSDKKKLWYPKKNGTRFDSPDSVR
jgi:DNA-binding NtrC family response regulator